MKGGAGNDLYYCKFIDGRVPVTSDGICRADRCKNCEKYEPDYPTFAEPFVILTYTGARIRFHPKQCSWEIMCSDDIIREKTLYRVEEWVNTKVQSSGKINLSEIKGREREYRLTIIGENYDGRCRWCSSFRKALAKFTNTSPVILDKCPLAIPKDGSQA